jgi:hypothetical protein
MADPGFIRISRVSPAPKIATTITPSAATLNQMMRFCLACLLPWAICFFVCLTSEGPARRGDALLLGAACGFDDLAIGFSPWR